MAKYELPIYGENDEIIKTYTTNVCPWAVFIQAAELQEGIMEKSAKEQLEAVEILLKAIFHGLTNDELACADSGDVMNTFQQIVQGSQQIKGGNSKNG